jgi:hypothetical protein
MNSILFIFYKIPGATRFFHPFSIVHKTWLLTHTLNLGHPIALINHVADKTVKDNFHRQIQPEKKVEDSLCLWDGFIFKFQHVATRSENPVPNILLVVQGFHVEVENAPEIPTETLV